ncbi:MAG: type II toxin-antitoxin system RelE/ParE family toxin [Luteolibacter sp.]
MKLEILAAAEAELMDSIETYESIEPGLGVRLKEEVRKFVDLIARDPERPRQRPAGYRRVNLQIFPFFIAYYLTEEVIWILAISHAHRRPEYWLSQKKQIP